MGKEVMMIKHGAGRIQDVRIPNADDRDPIDRAKTAQTSRSIREFVPKPPQEPKKDGTK
jgi:hypothetical protein